MSHAIIAEFRRNPAGREPSAKPRFGRGGFSNAPIGGELGGGGDWFQERSTGAPAFSKNRMTVSPCLSSFTSTQGATRSKVSRLVWPSTNLPPGARS